MTSIQLLHYTTLHYPIPYRTIPYHTILFILLTAVVSHVRYCFFFATTMFTAVLLCAVALLSAPPLAASAHEVSSAVPHAGEPLYVMATAAAGAGGVYKMHTTSSHTVTYDVRNLGVRLLEFRGGAAAKNTHQCKSDKCLPASAVVPCMRYDTDGTNAEGEWGCLFEVAARDRVDIVELACPPPGVSGRLEQCVLNYSISERSFAATLGAAFTVRSVVVAALLAALFPIYVPALASVAYVLAMHFGSSDRVCDVVLSVG